MKHRLRFYVDDDDPRPVQWPLPKGSCWWHTGTNWDGRAIVVAHIDPVALDAYWPDAEEVDDMGRRTLVFTDRFPRPDWFVDDADEGDES